MRRRSNRVETLQDEDGNWVEDGGAIKYMAIKYFSELFQADGMSARNFMKGTFPQLEVGMKEEIIKELKIEKAKKTLWEMSPYKAHGPNGPVPGNLHQKRLELAGGGSPHVRKRNLGRRSGRGGNCTCPTGTDPKGAEALQYKRFLPDKTL